MKQKEQELEYLRNTVCVYIFEHSFFLFLAGFMGYKFGISALFLIIVFWVFGIFILIFLNLVKKGGTKK